MYFRERWPVAAGECSSVGCGFGVHKLATTAKIRRSSDSLSATALLLLLAAACDEKKEAPKPMPPEVLVADVVQQDVPIYEQWVSTLNGPVNADITPKVQGYLLKQNYQNGIIRQEGSTVVRDRPAAVRSCAGQSKG